MWLAIITVVVMAVIATYLITSKSEPTVPHVMINGVGYDTTPAYVPRPPTILIDTLATVRSNPVWKNLNSYITITDITGTKSGTLKWNGEVCSWIAYPESIGITMKAGPMLIGANQLTGAAILNTRLDTKPYPTVNRYISAGKI